MTEIDSFNRRLAGAALHLDRMARLSRRLSSVYGLRRFDGI
ncbi:hypothetical protein [Mesorhizobium sp.]|nr:hypothetical protein [Mesorhizobium sp.]